jgi:hypothetical protein
MEIGTDDVEIEDDQTPNHQNTGMATVNTTAPIYPQTHMYPGNNTTANNISNSNNDNNMEIMMNMFREILEEQDKRHTYQTQVLIMEIKNLKSTLEERPLAQLREETAATNQFPPTCVTAGDACGPDDTDRSITSSDAQGFGDQLVAIITEKVDDAARRVQTVFNEAFTAETTALITHVHTFELATNENLTAATRYMHEATEETRRCMYEQNSTMTASTQSNFDAMSKLTQQSTQAQQDALLQLGLTLKEAISQLGTILESKFQEKSSDGDPIPPDLSARKKKRVKKTQSSQSTLNKFIFGYTPLEDAAIKLDEAFKTPIEDSVEITEL